MIGIKKHRWLTALLCLSMAAPALAAPAPVAVAPAAAGPNTLWHFLGIPQGFNKIRDARVNRNGNNPQRERKPPLKSIADPANLQSSNPAIARAAEIKQQEDMKKQKIKAIKYLATVGCGCYDGVKEALMEALNDCTEEVRYEAAMAIGEAATLHCTHCNKNCCCDEELSKKLAEIAYEMDDKCCFLEGSERVRQAAKDALKQCCPGRGPIGREMVPTPPAVPTIQPTPEEDRYKNKARILTPDGSGVDSVNPDGPPEPPAEDKQASPATPETPLVTIQPSQPGRKPVVVRNSLRKTQANAAADVTVKSRAVTKEAAKNETVTSAATRSAPLTDKTVAEVVPARVALAPAPLAPAPALVTPAAVAPIYAKPQSKAAVAEPAVDVVKEPAAEPTIEQDPVAPLPSSKPLVKRLAAKAVARPVSNTAESKLETLEPSATVDVAPSVSPQTSAAHKTPAAAPVQTSKLRPAVSTQGRLVGSIKQIDDSSDLIRVGFSGTQRPAKGFRMVVYHDFIFGSEQVGSLEVVGFDGNDVLAKRIGTFYLQGVAANDEVRFHGPLSQTPIAPAGNEQIAVKPQSKSLLKPMLANKELPSAPEPAKKTVKIISSPRVVKLQAAAKAEVAASEQVLDSDEETASHSDLTTRTERKSIRVALKPQTASRKILRASALESGSDVLSDPISEQPLALPVDSDNASSMSFRSND